MSNKEAKLLDIREKIDVFASAKAGFHTKGQTMTVSRPVAEKLIASGKACKTYAEAMATSLPVKEAAPAAPEAPAAPTAPAAGAGAAPAGNGNK